MPTSFTKVEIDSTDFLCYINSFIYKLQLSLLICNSILCFNIILIFTLWAYLLCFTYVRHVNIST